MGGVPYEKRPRLWREVERKLDLAGRRYREAKAAGDQAAMVEARLEIRKLGIERNRVRPRVRT